MPLTPLTAFADNYIWLLEHQRQCLVVDPGDGQRVLQHLAQTPEVQLHTILVTHHHADHTGGVAALKDITRAVVYAPAREDVAHTDHAVEGGNTLQLLGMPCAVLDVPGHTAGHVAYVVTPPAQAPILFCGDTLFSGGCGRLFEGTPAQMLDSLTRLAQLPDATQVCCAHEYTLSNLRFALAVEPDNAALQQHVRHCQALRAQQLPTLPSRMDTERAINPFLRTHEAAVTASAQTHDASAHTPVQVLAALRQWKNEFR